MEKKTVSELSGPPRPEFRLASLEELASTEKVFEGLKAQDWCFTNEPTAYLSHDIHPYPAKFIPQIPRNLILRLSLPGETVCDPFGGCGTTALEAILCGRSAISTDLNPLAKIIGQAKTLTLTKEEDDDISDLLEQLQFLSSDVSSLSQDIVSNRDRWERFIPAIPNILEWFHPNAIAELGYLRWRIENLESDRARDLARVSLSKSILKASYQDGETRYARRERETVEGWVVGLFCSNLDTALVKVRQLGPLLRFREPVFKTLDLRQDIVSDSNDPTSDEIRENRVDLIVTSPPYPNTTDYHLYHRFRLFWLGFDPRKLARSEIGSHLRHQKEATGFEQYLDEMKLCLINMYKMLRPGRYAVLVLGDGVFDGKICATSKELARLSSSIGFEDVGSIDRAVHATKRSFISPARRIRAETLLVLRKKPARLDFHLFSPPYKLWKYEEVLRTNEITALTGVSPRHCKNGDLVIRTSCLLIDKLRKLTFTHGFSASQISGERTWQAILENGDTALRKQRKDPKYATHGIHPYKGKFYPQLAKSLFNLARLQPRSRILDPFCGSGTVLLESYLNGFYGFGVDLNVLAVKIARVKTAILDVDPYLRDRVLARFLDRLRRMEGDPVWAESLPDQIQNELVSWFPKKVLTKLGWVFNEIAQVAEPRIRELLEVLISSIVRDISQQDPKDLRIRRRADMIEDAPVGELLALRISDVRKRLQHFSERSKNSPTYYFPAAVIEGDCREPNVFELNDIEPGSIDAIVTSPPYATALPYIDTDRLSILLLFGLTSRGRASLESSLIGSREISKKKRKEVEHLIDNDCMGDVLSSVARQTIREVRTRNSGAEVGFRRENTASLLYVYFRDMSVALRNLDKVLKKGGDAFFVIGDNRTTAGGKEITIRSGKALQEIGTSIGWKLVDVIPITVTTENRLHNKNSITENEIVWLRKAVR